MIWDYLNDLTHYTSTNWKLKKKRNEKERMNETKSQFRGSDAAVAGTRRIVLFFCGGCVSFASFSPIHFPDSFIHSFADLQIHWRLAHSNRNRTQTYLTIHHSTNPMNEKQTSIFILEDFFERWLTTNVVSLSRSLSASVTFSPQKADERKWRKNDVDGARNQNEM